MEEVFKIIQELKENSGNELQRILERNKDNELLKEILYFVYNPYITTGLSKKKICKEVTQLKLDVPNDILQIINYLKNNNTGTDKNIRYVQIFIMRQSINYQPIYEEIFTKELRLGITAKTINKVWKDFIPEFNVMLAEKYWDRMDELEKEKPDIIITQKFDRDTSSCKSKRWKYKNIFKTR